MRGKALFETNRKEESMSDLRYLIKNAKNEAGAEAHLMLAEIYYAKKEFENVEKIVNDLFSYPYTTTFWSTKAMLMMADLYLEKNEEQNAEAVLKTIVENADTEEFIKQAEEKLKALKAKQQLRLVPPADTEMKVEFDTDPTDAKLYDSLAPIIDSIRVNPSLNQE